MPHLSSQNEIESFIHCPSCIRDRPSDVTMRNYARFELGWTETGIQVWCPRHEVNVINIDFQGCKHPSNTKAEEID